MNRIPTSLEKAIAAIKAGDKQTGRWLLAQALQTDPRDERVWIWMSSVVDTNAQRRECLERALAINPNNEMARRGLAKLDGASIASTPTQPTPSPTHETLGTRPAQAMKDAPGDDSIETPRDSSWANADAPISADRPATRTPAEFVVSELARGRKRSDIVVALCNEMNFAWNDAEKFIQKVEAENRRRITARQSPLLLVLGIGIILGGLGLGGFGLYELANGVLFISLDLIVTRFGMPTPVMVITGLAMLAGGAWGVLRTLGSIARREK